MTDLLNQFAASWWQWMAPMFWQVSLLILLIGAIDALTRRWIWPQVRYGLWILVLIKLLIPPTWSMPSSIIPILRPTAEKVIVRQWEKTFPSSAEQRTQTIQAVPSGTEATIDKTLSSSSQIQAASPKSDWQIYAIAVWILGMIAFTLVLYIRIRRLRRWHREQEKKQTIPVWFHKLLVQTAEKLKLPGLPAIVFSDQAVTPAVYGIFHPVMLFPAHYFDHLSRKEAEHVLLHELTHVKRGDLLLHTLNLLLQIVYWFNPLMIWVGRRIKHIREICCDLTVAEILKEKTPAYRQTLLDTARELLTETVEPGMGLLGVFEEPFRLVTRLKWLEKKSWKNRRWIIVTASSVCLILFVTIMPMAGMKQKTDGQISEREMADTIQIKGITSDSKTGIPPEQIPLPITMKQIEPFDAVLLEKTGSYDKIEEALIELKKLVDESRIKVTGMPFARFFNESDKVAESMRAWEVGFPVRPGARVKPPLILLHIGPQQVASTMIDQPTDMENLWSRFIKKVQNQGLIPCFPPAMEIYNVDLYTPDSWKGSELRIQAFRPDVGYPGMKITIKETEPVTAVILSNTGSYSQVPETMEKLEKYLKKKKIQLRGYPFGQYYSSDAEMPREELYWELGIPVDKNTEVEPPFEVRRIPGHRVAAATFKGPFNMEYPWAAFVMQTVLQGVLPGPPGIEIFKCKLNKLEKSEFETELQIPISSSEQLSHAVSTMGDKVKRKETDKHESIESIKAKIEAINDSANKALLAGDTEKILSYYLEDVIYNPNYHPVLRGKKTVKEAMIESHKRWNTQFYSFNTNITDLWQCSDQIIEIGTYCLSASHNAAPHPVAENGNYITIWQKQEDGSYKVKLTMWNTSTNPSE